MQKVILIGHSITAEILYAYLRGDERYEVIGLAVDDDFLTQGGIEGVPCVGLSKIQETYPPHECCALMAVGYNTLNKTRESLFLRVKEMGYSVLTYVHPDARVFTEYPLGEGCVILPSVIEPYVKLGANTMIWCHVTLAHHSSIAENCWIASGAVISGQAKILRNSFLGVNATVVNEVTVEAYNIIGASALISKNTKPYTVHLARSAEPFRASSEDYVKYFGV